MKKIDNNFSEPTKQQLINLVELYQAGRYDDVEKLSLSITKEFPKHPFAWKVLAAVLKQNGKINDAVIVSQKSVKLNPKDPEAHKNLGILLHEQNKLKESEESFKQAISLKPNYAEAYSNLGNILREQNKLKESEESFKQSISLKPNYAEAYSNLGNTLQEQGRLREAEVSYKKAIELKPDFANAYSNLGTLLKDMGRLSESCSALKKAIELKPDFANAYSNLGTLLKDMGRLSESCSALIQAINLNPHFSDAYANLGIAIKNIKFNSSNVKLYPILIELLNKGNFARPEDLAGSICGLLKHDPLIKNLLIKKNFPSNIEKANLMINSLDKLKLLHHLMRVCPLPDLQFESLFVEMRNLLLSNLDNIEETPEFIYFLSTLSLHCFTNEYVYIEKDKETKLIEGLETEIMQTIEQRNQPEIKKILCLASYRPLHQYKWCKKLNCLDNIEEVKLRLIEEPYAEREIVKEIPILEEISDDISRKVRAQYEQNPYPRWVKTGIPLKTKSISEVCAELNLHLQAENIKKVSSPVILIAGCGTGQTSIGTASSFSDCKVTAADLSLASIAYAKRKTNELGITNLEYLQADILKLHKLEKKFDIIDSVGVLHHMEEPMAGWKVLTNLLKPGGLMRIGLYSELARQEIVKIRKEIALKKVGTSESEIRQYRQKLAYSNDKDHKQLTKSSDFYSLSTLRDLIFHVQEHRFTIPEIKKCLEELELKFCGFINKDTISNFRKFHGEDANIYDLEQWNQFEQSNPRTFAVMYQFWCQKI
ncbi:tetratricopeptide repeat protein [Candidatus Pelagibacter sp. HIMB1748]|uniref:tetratricopeptide repeat protein n=1 Tax=Candidatus Pelagibacter sp. HIMB1748 TaxID=3413371 RepID=UPI003F83216A